MKILPIFATFSKKDWHWFHKFVQSPIYNQHTAVLRLLEFFKGKQAKEKKVYSSDFLHKKIFPNAPFDAAKVHHTANYLLRNAEDFLAWDEWWQDTPNRQCYLLQAYRQRGLDRPFAETFEKLQQATEQHTFKNAEHYRYRFQLSLESYKHSMQSGGHSTAEQLHLFAQWHDISFVAEKLKYACGVFSHQHLLQTEFDMGLLPAVLDFVSARPAWLDIPAISVYYYGYLTLREPDEDTHFFTLKKLLESNAPIFPHAELRAVYLLAINFCIRRINLRQEAFLSEVFELYKNGLKSGVFFEKNQISRSTYTNIALTALRLREFDWTYAFLLDHHDKLPDNQRQGTFSYNLARYHCERGDYAQAMPLLLAMDFDDLLHNLTAKAMLAKMYWEMAEINALESLLASFSAYLRRKRQISEQQRSAYQHFIRFVRRLQALPPGNKAAAAALKEEIASTVLVAEKDWLLRMMYDV